MPAVQKSFVKKLENFAQSVATVYKSLVRNNHLITNIQNIYARKTKKLK